MSVKNYITLRDAIKATGDHRYGHGQSSVWFVKKEHSASFLQGFRHLKNQSPSLLLNLSNPDETLLTTHAKIGYVDEITPEHILEMMQRSVWCPDGQADQMLKLKHTNHSSMTVGDLIKLKNGKVIMVDSVGFVDLETQKKYTGIRDEHMKFRTLAASLRKVAAVDLQESGFSTPARSLMVDIMNEIRTLRSGYNSLTPEDKMEIAADTLQDAVLLFMSARKELPEGLESTEQTEQLKKVLMRAQRIISEIKSL